MGRRGRQKAKQTRVARELKYSSGPTDLDQLARELAAQRHPGDPLPVVQTGLDGTDGADSLTGPPGSSRLGSDQTDGDDTDDDGDDVDYRRYSAYDDGDDLPANGTYNR